MYNLTQHIEYLLLRHDCVVVPGLGAFINVRQSARLDAATGKWQPMIREVRFNSAVTHDDGLLANSYARKNKTGFQESRDLLRKDIARLLDTLENDREVTLGYLGILRLGEGTLSFQPLHSARRWAQLLGYNDVPLISEAANIEDPTASDSTKMSKEEETVPTEAVSAARKENPAGVKKFDTARNYYIAINKTFARAAACLLLVMGITLSILLPRHDTRNIEQASVMPGEHLLREKVRHSVVREPQQEPEKKEPTKTVEPSELRYHLIVGTFMTREEAEKFISQRRDSSITLAVVETRTRARVSAMSSDDKDALQRQMTTEEFKKAYPQAWIWEKPEN